MMNAFDNFMPHGHCYFWRPEIMYPMVVSDIVIGASYVTLTILLIVFARKRPDIPYRWIFWGFGAFILACGVGHFIDAWNVNNADYAVQAAWRIVTSIVSLAVAIMGLVFFPRFLKAPSTLQLKEAYIQIDYLNERLAYEKRLNKCVVVGVSAAREGLVIDAIKALEIKDYVWLKDIFSKVSLGALRFRLSMGDFLLTKKNSDLSKTVMRLCSKFALSDQYVRKNILFEHDSKRFEKALDELLLNAVDAGDANPVIVLNKSKGSIVFSMTNFCNETPKVSDLDIPYYTTKESWRGLGFPYAKQIMNKHGGFLKVEYINNKLTVKVEFKI